MSHISTYWEKDLEPPREAFKVTGDVGYTKSTDILLDYKQLETIELEHCTATFEVDVVGDRGSSAIVIYNNGVRSPFYINGVEYQQLAWTSQSQKTTITIPLNYVTSNNIQARYLGNNQCLASKSKVVSITEPRPPAAESNLTITVPKLSYRKSESVSGTVLLEADSHNADVPVKLYINNELISTLTTDENGEASFSLASTDFDDGINKIKAEFEGNIYIYDAKETLEISHGWNIQILDYDKAWLNYIGSVAVRLTDYFENPIANETLWTDNSVNQVGSLSGTTDAGGYAIIENHNGGNVTPRFSSFVIHTNYGDLSSAITPKNAFIDEFEVSTQGIIANGYSLPIKVRVTAVDENNQPVSLKGLSVSSKLSNPKTTVLDSNGEATVNYNGNSRGDVVETITLGSNGGSKSVSIEDCVTYWTKYSIETEYNFENSYTVESAKVYNGSAHYRLSGVGDFGHIYFDKWKDWSSDWTFEFQVNTVTNPDTIMLCGYNLTNVKANDIVKIVHEGSYRRIYINNVLKSTYRGNEYNYPIFTFNQGSKGRMELRRLKFKVNSDSIYNIGNLGHFTIENNQLCVEFTDDLRYCDYTLEDGYLYVETELPQECFSIEDGVLYCTPPSD